MKPRLWHLAFCMQCETVQPFRDEDQRDTWAADHGANTGHEVLRIEQQQRAKGEA